MEDKTIENAPSKDLANKAALCGPGIALIMIIAIPVLVIGGFASNSTASFSILLITLFGVAAPILWATSLFLAFKAYKLSRAERKSTRVYNRLGGDIAIVVIFLDLVFFLPIVIYILGFIFEALI